MAAFVIPSIARYGQLFNVQDSSPSSAAVQADTPTSPAVEPRIDISSEEAGFLADHDLIYGDVDRKVAMLTYDDARSNNRINYLLDVFRENGFHTTFFIIGSDIEKCTAAIPRIIAEGHDLGCHGWVHEPMTSQSDNALHAQFSQFIDAVGQIVPGYRVRFFRAPYGDRNDRVRRIAAAWGMQHALWSLESGGEDRSTYHNVVDRIQPGHIVLSHETRFFDVNDADVIVRELIRKGYSLESLSTGAAPSDRWQPA